MNTDLSQTSLTLLEQVGQGRDPLAERRFVERYGAMVRRIAMAARLGEHDADDVVQETMVAAVQALREQRYDRERGRFKVWLKGVLYHKIAHVRRKASRSEAPSGVDPAIIEPASPLGGNASSSLRGRAPSPLPSGENASSPLSSGERAASPLPSGGKTASPLPSGGSRATSSRVPLSEVVDPAPSPDEQVEHAFELEWMKALYDEASEEVRNEVEPHTWQAFDLVANHGWSPSETARLLGMKRSVVDNAKSRVLKRLKDKVAELDNG